MRLLLISQAFPPFNTSGAVRVGKLGSYLLEQGHDVRVLTSSPLPYPRTLAVEVPANLVLATRSADPIELLGRLRGKTVRKDPQAVAIRARSGRFGRALRRIAGSLALPEPQIGWLPSAVWGGRRLLRSWVPDLIYASALPLTAHIVAAILAARRTPWVAEFRDHFADNPYSNLPSWRRPIDRGIERLVVSSASACVTVSGPMADTLRSRYGKETLVVLNGYDDREQSNGPSESWEMRMTSAARLNVVYTGIIYPGRRDPTALFEAVRSLGPAGAGIEITFYGQDLRGVAELAHRAGVSDHVRLRGPIPHAHALDAQRRADVLLLLLWNDPREAGVYTGKLFEYVGAGRPVLAIGAESGVAADLIRSRGLGVAASDPFSIARAIRVWVAEKEQTGRIAGPADASRSGLSRREQFARLSELFSRLNRSERRSGMTALSSGSL